MHTNNHGPVVRERSTYMTDSDAQMICQAFADGLQAGLSYARILDMLERQGQEKRVLDRLRNALLEHGDMLGEGFARYGLLDASARNLVLVAEQQGELPGTFKQLAKIYGQRHKRKKKLFFSFVEPMFLIIIGMIYGRRLFSSNFTELAFQSDTWGQIFQIFINASIESAIFIIICTFFAFVSINLPVDMPIRKVLHRIILRIPFIGGPGNLYALSLFCLYIRQSITSGMTVLKSIELAAEASNSPQIRSKIHLVQREIENGSTLAHSLRSIKSLPDDIINTIDIGEESGTLEERLEWLAAHYEELSQESFQRVMNSFLYIARFAIVIAVISSLMMVILSTDLFPNM